MRLEKEASGSLWKGVDDANSSSKKERRIEKASKNPARQTGAH